MWLLIKKKMLTNNIVIAGTPKRTIRIINMIYFSDSITLSNVATLMENFSNYIRNIK